MARIPPAVPLECHYSPPVPDRVRWLTCIITFRPETHQQPPGLLQCHLLPNSQDPRRTSPRPPKVLICFQAWLTFFQTVFQTAMISCAYIAFFCFGTLISWRIFDIRMVNNYCIVASTGKSNFFVQCDFECLSKFHSPALVRFHPHIHIRGPDNLGSPIFWSNNYLSSCSIHRTHSERSLHDGTLHITIKRQGTCNFSQSILRGRSGFHIRCAL